MLTSRKEFKLNYEDFHSNLKERELQERTEEIRRKILSLREKVQELDKETVLIRRRTPSPDSYTTNEGSLNKKMTKAPLTPSSQTHQDHCLGHHLKSPSIKFKRKANKCGLITPLLVIKSWSENG